MLSLLNLLILFGGIQALSLCFYLSFRKPENKLAYRYFLLFLASLAIFNIGYAAIFWDISLGPLHAGSHPIPYKYLIAPALFGYVAYSLKQPTASLWKGMGLLLIPALLYGIIRLYWVYMIVSGSNPLIMKEVYDTGFFTLNEILTLFFDLGIGLFLLRMVQRHFSRKETASFGKGKYWKWLQTLPKAVILLSVLHLLLLIASYVFAGQHNRTFYYPSLILNSLFVYWLGFVGFTRPNLLFFSPLLTSPPISDQNTGLQEELQKAMEEEKIYTNPKLTSHQLAVHLDIPATELTRYLNDRLGCNFSQYLNSYRTQEVIRLMNSELSATYKVEALALRAGFNSRSSFYKVFKEQTGQTPSAFVKAMA